MFGQHRMISWRPAGLVPLALVASALSLSATAQDGSCGPGQDAGAHMQAGLAIAGAGPSGFGGGVLSGALAGAVCEGGEGMRALKQLARAAGERALAGAAFGSGVPLAA